MVARDQMVGPHQTPVSDVAVTATSYKSYNGEALSMGERTAIALLSAPASGRMAVGEAITNIAAANIGPINNIKLSANWMCACNEEGEDANLYDTVKAVGIELCPQLGISIPVGKDSLSMRTIWQTTDTTNHKMTAPLSLVVSSFATVKDVRKTVTPDLKPGRPSTLLLLDLGSGKHRLASSSLARVYNQIGNECPDLDNPQLVVNFFNAIQEMIDKQLLMAYHDRSDGGLFTTLAEMAFGAHAGLKVNITHLNTDPVPALFSEELGAVIQIADTDREQVDQILSKHELNTVTHNIGTPVFPQDSTSPSFKITCKDEDIFKEDTLVLKRTWSELTFHMQTIRDNPECARQEYNNILDENDKGMTFKLTFDPAEEFNITSPARPRMAILREQGINGQVEMAAAFDRAGFECADVHMTDLLNGNINLKDFAGLVACGGFSYGDVLGAGTGWAKSILYNPALKDMFSNFFQRPDTFTLGVCNGCQMISQLKDIIPGARDWPEFTRNLSEQFEARYVTVEIEPSPSILFKDMEGSRLGIPVAHGEGCADFTKTGSKESVLKHRLVSVNYVDNYGCTTERYPFNPNGSPRGITGLTTIDGRATIMMPHPERVFRSLQMSYRPADMFKDEQGPWLRMFQNARQFISL
jgi:phosphoribosylformylglycinamidine synthase